MTGPVTTEALVEGKPTRRTLIQAQARRHYEHVCSLHEMIRSLEAALQQVTAERDAKTDVLAEMKLCAEATADERERLLSELARLRAEGEAKDRDNAVTALMVIALCNSVLGNAYLGKDGEEALAGHVKAAFMNTALARAITNTGD